MRCWERTGSKKRSWGIVYNAARGNGKHFVGFLGIAYTLVYILNTMGRQRILKMSDISDLFL